MGNGLALKDGSFTIFLFFKTNYTWKLGLLINTQSERKFLFKRKILISSHFLVTKCKSGEMSHGERNGDMGPRPGLEDLPLPPWASVSNFSIFWINLVSFPEVHHRETSGSYMSGSSMAGGGSGWGGWWTSLYSFKQTSLWCQSFLIPPYSISVEESSGLFFLVSKLMVGQKHLNSLYRAAFSIGYFCSRCSGDRWSVTLGYKTQERGQGLLWETHFLREVPQPISLLLHLEARS